MELANVDTVQAEQPTLTIDQGTAPVQPPSDAVAKTRAYKAHMGIGDIIKQDYDQIYRNIADGREDAIRKDAALTITANAMEQRQRDLVNLAATKGRALTSEDVSSLDSTPADPKSVIEQGYGRAYVNTVHDAAGRLEDNIITDAQAQDPEALQKYLNKGSDVLSKREYAATAVQNLEPEIDKNSWLTFKDPFFDDKHHIGSYDVKQLLSLGFYQSAVLRGNTKETSRIGFLGNVLEEQANELKQLPFDQFQREFDKILTNLKTYDPVVAQQFAQAVSGLSGSDKIIYNTSEAVNVAVAATVLKGGKTVANNIGENQVKRLGGPSVSDSGITPKGPLPSGGPRLLGNESLVKNSDGLVQGLDGVYRKVNTNTGTEIVPLNQAQVAKAIDDVVKSATIPEITKASIAEGAGDVKEAAVQKAVTSITRPNPIKDGLNTLLTLSRSDYTVLKENPSNLSREFHTRLLDAAAGFEKGTIDILTNTSQVVRTPLLMEDGFRGIADKIRDYFPGRENTIADIDMRVQELGPLTIHADVKIVNYDGTPFSSYELAANHARINGYPLEGIEGKAGSMVYLSPTAVKNLESTVTKNGETRFYIKDGIEVIPHANPAPGLFPVETTKGYVGKELNTGVSSSSGNLTYQGYLDTTKSHKFTLNVDDQEIAVYVKSLHNKLKLDSIVSEGTGVFENDIVNKVGPSKIRNALKDLQEFFPNATSIEGERVSGSRSKQFKYGISGALEWPKVSMKLTPLDKGEGVKFHPQLTEETNKFEKPVEEVVKQAAIRIDGEIYTGKTHFDAVNKWIGNEKDTYKLLGTPEEGFITSSGRFVDKKEAEGIANNVKPLTKETARIEQQGLGFHIIVTKPLDETMTFVRDGLIGNSKTHSTSNVDTSRLTSIGNAVLGYVRNPYDTLSRVENENRAKTVFGQNKFLEHIKNEISAVEDIYKGVLGDRSIFLEKPLSYTRTVTGANRLVAQQFTRALEVSQTLADPATGLPGYYMKTPAELEFFWQSNFQRTISMKEMTAYLAVGRLDHFDHILRQVSEYRNKSRLGVQSWSFKTVTDGKDVPSPIFDARQVKIVNLNPDEITLIHDVTGTETYLHSKSPTAQKEFIKLVEQGRFTGVELYDPEKRPISRADSDGNPLRIRYIFSNAMNSKPLTYDQIGYRGGGHWEYDYEHSVKQAIVKPQRLGTRVQHIYEGDATFGFVSNRAMGEDFAKQMNEVARLIRVKDIKAAKAYAKSVFDIEWKDLYGGFRPSKNPTTGNIQPARFSTDPRQEFRVVPKGRSIFDLDKELASKYTKVHPKTQVVSSTFVDGTRHGSLARNFQTAYTQARESYDLKEPFNAGTPDKPFYQFRAAKLTDPIATMTRALNRIVNSTYMDDMKISSVEHWLEENKGLLDADINQIRSSPFYYFNEGKFKNNPDNILQRLNAESNRYKIKQLLGQPSKIDTAIHGVKQALSDSRYEAKGTLDKAIKAPLIVPEWLLDKVHHPIDFLRGMTYHLNLGLFALKQVVVQSMAYTTIYGLAGPRLATAGSFGAWMHQWSRISRNPAIIAEMDKRAVHFGWKLGEFAEANKIIDRIGFGRIGNEISLDNGLKKQSFFRNDAKAVLDKGQVFFHEGNLHVRFGAWYTAFKEFREKFPVKKIGPIEEGQIVYRANYLNVLMTRDANTILNKGLVGVPFQFYDFMKKMADVFWSKNIGDAYPTLVEGKDGVYRSSNTTANRAYVRMRMFLLYAMLGGAAGATGVSGLPFGDTIRKHALEGTLPFQTEAYVPGDHLWSTIVMEGTVSTLVNGLTGNFYNFNNRFNPNGLQVLRDVVQTDPTFWKILLGAMGTTVANEASSLSGFVNAMYSMMEGDPKKEAWPLKIDDWMAPLKIITSWKDAERLQYALAFGKWLDTHGRPVSDVTKIDAVFRTVTGLTDQRIDDMYLKTLTMKDRKAMYDKALAEFEHESRLAEQSAAAGDTEQANDYNKRAFFALTSRNVPIELWPKALSRRAVMNKDTIEKNNDSYYRQYVPTNLQDKAREADRKIQQMKAK